MALWLHAVNECKRNCHPMWIIGIGGGLVLGGTIILITGVATAAIAKVGMAALIAAGIGLLAARCWQDRDFFLNWAKEALDVVSKTAGLIKTLLEFNRLLSPA